MKIQSGIMCVVLQANAEAKKALEERDAMAAEFEEYRRTNQMLKGKLHVCSL